MKYSSKFMKQLNALFVLCLLSTLSFSQNLSTSTNEMHFNFSDGRPLNSNQLPAINWIYPRLEYTSSSENKLEIQAEVKSLYELKELKITVGDRASGVPNSTKIIDINSDEKKYLLHESIYLPNSSNFVEVVVTTIQGAIVSSHRDILVGTGSIADAVFADRKDYALLFVTDKYDNWDDLVNPVEDGRSIAKQLKEKYGFEVEVVENATINGVWEKLREYNSKKFKPQDQLLVFFAGHGHFDETFGEGYVVAKNSLRKDPARNTYISHNRLRGVINNIPVEHVFLVMDVCYGGTLDPVIARARGNEADYTATTNEVISRKLNLRTRKYLTSGGKEYVSDGVAGKHSPFAAKFLESLASYGGDDGVLTTLKSLIILKN